MSRRRQPTQRDRVLAALRRARRRGVTPIDFHAPHVVDGGKPIIRLAPRIHELRELGHEIEVRRDRGVARYVLVEPAHAGRSTATPAPTSPIQLELPAPAASPFDPRSEWA